MVRYGVVRRLVTILAVVFTVSLATPTVAFGQTYGFDQTCNDLHDALDSIGVPGVSLGDAASAACKAGNAATHPGDAVTAVRDKAWDSTFGKVVDALMSGLGQALVMALTFWMKVPNERISDTGALFRKINDYTYQAQILLLMVSVIFTGARLAESRRGAVMGEAVESFRMFARVVFSSWMLGAIVIAGSEVSDRFSAWVINDSSNGNARDIADMLVKTSKVQAFSPGLVLIVAIVGLLGALAQVVLAIVRQGMLVVAAGVLPLAAAASGTNTGRQSYPKLVSWIIAFLLWKPVAAIVYMIAFVAMGDTDETTATGASLPDADEAQRTLVALVLLCSVAFVLPVLMRLVTPVVAIAGSGGSGLASTGTVLLGAAALGAVGTKAVGARSMAAVGSPGYVGRGRGPRPPGAGPGGGGGGGGPRPTPPRGPSGGSSPAAARPAASGSGGPVPSAASNANRSASNAMNPIAAVRTAGASLTRADAAMGDIAGDRWANREPDLGRSTIPR